MEMKSIDKSSLLPAYHQLTTILRCEIAESHKPGDLLPSQNAMMAKYGVSYGTVMRSLSDLQREGLITRERGRGTFVNGPAAGLISEKPGSRPLAHARRTGSIAALLTQSWDRYDSDPFFKEMIYDLTKSASGHQYTVQWLASDVIKPSRLAKLLMERPVDGLVVFNRSELPDEALEAIKRSMPIVTTEKPRHGQDQNIPWVEVDSFEGIQLAMRRLIEAGHQRIAFLNGEAEHHVTFASRLEAYRRCLKDAGIPYSSELVVETEDLSIASAAKLVPPLLAKNPTALLSANGRLTIGALQAIQQQGLRIPEDISLIGYDDDPLFCLTTPAVTMVQQPIAEFAAQLVETLWQLIRGHELAQIGKLLLPKLIERQSVQEPPALRASRSSR